MVCVKGMSHRHMSGCWATTVQSKFLWYQKRSLSVPPHRGATSYMSCWVLEMALVKLKNSILKFCFELIWETWVRSLGPEDPLEKEMATHTLSTLAWKGPRTKKPGRLQSMGWQRAAHDWATSLLYEDGMIFWDRYVCAHVLMFLLVKAEQRVWMAAPWNVNRDFHLREEEGWGWSERTLIFPDILQDILKSFP